MLAWRLSIELCDRGVYFDLATLGRASNRLALPDLAARLYPAARPFMTPIPPATALAVILAHFLE